MMMIGVLGRVDCYAHFAPSRYKWPTADSRHTDKKPVIRIRLRAQTSQFGRDIGTISAVATAEPRKLAFPDTVGRWNSETPGGAQGLRDYNTAGLE